MKNILVLLLLFVPIHSFGYDFKGYEMGITLTDFKSRGVHKDVWMIHNLSSGRLVCSDESPRETEFVFRLDKYPVNTVIFCRFMDRMNLSIGNREYPIDPMFLFVKQSSDKDYFLSQIDFETPSSVFNELVSSLKIKYKNPVSTSGQNVQNMMGSQFRNQTLIWKDKISEIEIQKFGGSIDKSQVLFVHLQGEKIMKKLESDKKKNPTSGF